MLRLVPPLPSTSARCLRHQPTTAYVYQRRWKTNERTRTPRASHKHTPNFQSAEPQNTIIIHSWEPIESMAEVYTIVRAVERKYGKILEFKCLTDYERPDYYQSVIFAVFADPEKSFGLFPRGNPEIRVTSTAKPAVLRAGGVGLDELQGVLESVDTTEAPEPQKTPSFGELLTEVVDDVESDGKTLNLKIERAARSWSSAGQKYFMPDRIRLDVGREFMKWGGFAQPSLAPLVDEHTPVDRVKMRTVLSDWSRELGVPDPNIVQAPPPAPPTTETVWEVPPEGEELSTPLSEEWENLPNSEDAVNAEAEMMPTVEELINSTLAQPIDLTAEAEAHSQSQQPSLPPPHKGKKAIPRTVTEQMAALKVAQAKAAEARNEEQLKEVAKEENTEGAAEKLETAQENVTPTLEPEPQDAKSTVGVSDRLKGWIGGWF